MSGMDHARGSAVAPGAWYREKQVLQVFPFSSATLWRMAKAGKFPKPRKLGPNITAWSGDDLLDFDEAQKKGVEWAEWLTVKAREPAQ